MNKTGIVVAALAASMLNAFSEAPEPPEVTPRQVGPMTAPRGVVQAFGLSIPCMVSQLAKASNQPVLVVSLGYIPKP